MERNLLRTPEIKEEYDNTILEYLQLGHMRKIATREIAGTRNIYLPHQLRVAFNTSSPSSTKVSLNDPLYPGPILQQDPVLQILKWRLFMYVFIADVTKMYRQILLDTNQIQFQRILFRKSPGLTR